VDADDWDRDTFLHVLRIGSQDEIKKDDLRQVVTAWTGKAGLAADLWNLQGPESGKNFHVAFKGEGVIGPRHAKRCNFSLKKEDGQWEKLFVKTEGGGESQLFISPDQSPQARKISTMARKVLKSLREHYPNKRFSCPQGADVIRVHGEELAMLEAKDRDHHDVYWSYEILEKLPIDKDRAMEAFNEHYHRGSASSTTQWRL
jgi:hypothetical protein